VSRRGSNTAALLLNCEKGFGQAMSPIQQQINYGFGSTNCFVNNNNKSEMVRMTNGIDHEDNLILPETKQNQTALDAHKPSNLSSVTKSTSASIQPSNVVAGSAATHQHAPLVSSYTGSIIS